jgi:hypothetical protein
VVGHADIGVEKTVSMLLSHLHIAGAGRDGT